MTTLTKDERDFLAWLEIERRNRAEKEQEFKSGKRITYEEGMKRYSQLTEEEWQLKIEHYCSLALAQQEQQA